jgi:hypothetical protein
MPNEHEQAMKHARTSEHTSESDAAPSYEQYIPQAYRGYAGGGATTQTDAEIESISTLDITNDSQSSSKHENDHKHKHKHKHEHEHDHKHRHEHEHEHDDDDEHEPKQPTEKPGQAKEPIPLKPAPVPNPTTPPTGSTTGAHREGSPDVNEPTVPSEPSTYMEIDDENDDENDELIPFETVSTSEHSKHSHSHKNGPQPEQGQMKREDFIKYVPQEYRHYVPPQKVMDQQKKEQGKSYVQLTTVDTEMDPSEVFDDEQNEMDTVTTSESSHSKSHHHHHHHADDHPDPAPIPSIPPQQGPDYQQYIPEPYRHYTNGGQGQPGAGQPSAGQPTTDIQIDDEMIPFETVSASQHSKHSHSKSSSSESEGPAKREDFIKYVPPEYRHYVPSQKVMDQQRKQQERKSFVQLTTVDTDLNGIELLDTAQRSKHPQQPETTEQNGNGYEKYYSKYMKQYAGGQQSSGQQSGADYGKYYGAYMHYADNAQAGQADTTEHDVKHMNSVDTMIDSDQLDTMDDADTEETVNEMSTSELTNFNSAMDDYASYYEPYLKSSINDNTNPSSYNTNYAQCTPDSDSSKYYENYMKQQKQSASHSPAEQYFEPSKHTSSDRNVESVPLTNTYKKHHISNLVEDEVSNDVSIPSIIDMNNEPTIDNNTMFLLMLCGALVGMFLYGLFRYQRFYKSFVHVEENDQILGEKYQTYPPPTYGSNV